MRRRDCCEPQSASSLGAGDECMRILIALRVLLFLSVASAAGTPATVDRGGQHNALSTALIDLEVP